MPLLFEDQCRVSASVRYRPESRVAWTEAILIFAGEEPAVDQIRCGLVRLIYSGWKNSNEGKIADSERNWSSQCEIIFFLTKFWILILKGVNLGGQEGGVAHREDINYGFGGTTTTYISFEKRIGWMHEYVGYFQIVLLSSQKETIAVCAAGQSQGYCPPESIPLI